MQPITADSNGCHHNINHAIWHLLQKQNTWGAVVMYRKPHSNRFALLLQESQPRVLQQIDEIPLTGGYVIAPFQPSPTCPIQFVEPDFQTTCLLEWPQHCAAQPYTDDTETQRANYAHSFEQAHRRLMNGELQKMVLSRRLNLQLPIHETTEVSGDENFMRLMEAACGYFQKACHYRPNSFVAFWWTKESGAWLVATPEPLLERRQHDWGTVALAGTLPWVEGEKPQWNEKNLEEQPIVSRFVERHLRETAVDVRKSDTYSLHTGNIQHLCTDFSFTLEQPGQVTQLLAKLHPTPAVCGLPRPEAFQAILADETSPRHYYAGFSGPLLLEGETHLYVSLRCMQFTTQTATLYAGGGIMPGSNENDEWEETQRKLQTMLKLF